MAQLWWRNRIREQHGSRTWIPKTEHDLSCLCREKWILQHCFCSWQDRRTSTDWCMYKTADERTDFRMTVSAEESSQSSPSLPWTCWQGFIHSMEVSEQSTVPRQPYGGWNVLKAEQIRIRWTLTCAFPFYSAGTESSNSKLGQEVRICFQKFSERHSIHKSSLWSAGLLAQS